ncbi:hypothetical protein [Allocoleopsis sp.]|uniref:hypothetical protein n=1 Tax=Allocoleopsis sp. TaxID=3088169 RepID=UPI002FD6630D
MFRKSPIQKSSHPTLDVSPLQEFVVELDEHNEELLSGGSLDTLGILQPQVLKKDPEPLKMGVYFDYISSGLS